MPPAPTWDPVGVKSPAPLLLATCESPPGAFLGGFNKVTGPFPALSFTCLGVSCFL